MREFLRNWLGIKDQVVVDRPIDKEEIRIIVVQALNEAMQPENRFKSIFNVDITGSFERAIRRIVLDQIDNQVTGAINRRVDPEDFIDKIVTRIKSKQLK